METKETNVENELSEQDLDQVNGALLEQFQKLKNLMPKIMEMKNTVAAAAAKKFGESGSEKSSNALGIAYLGSLAAITGYSLTKVTKGEADKQAVDAATVHTINKVIK